MTSPPPRALSARVGIVLLVVAGLSWGTSGVLGTLLVRASGLPFLSVAAYRILVGGLLLTGFALAGRRFRPPRTRAGILRIALLGGASAVFQLAFFSAVGAVGVSVATLVAIGSAPVFVLVVDLATGRQRLHPRLVAALACTAAGLALFMGTPPAGIDPAEALLGCGLAVVAGAAFASISLLGARPHPDFDDVTGTALAFGLGGLVVLVVAAASGGPIAFAPTPASVALVLLLGLIPSAVAYFAYLTGLKAHSSTTGVLVSLLEPVTGAVLAAVVLGERLPPAGLVGAGLLLAAVALVAWPTRGSAREVDAAGAGLGERDELGVGVPRGGLHEPGVDRAHDPRVGLGGVQEGAGVEPDGPVGDGGGEPQILEQPDGRLG